MLHFDYRDDLFQDGYSEDGEPVIGRAFSVIATTETGRRFIHTHVVTSFWRGAEDAIAEIEALKAKIERHYQDGGKLDANHWRETDPAYGSDAYAFFDRQGVWLARERKQDRDNGENVPLDARLDGPLEDFHDLPDLDIAAL